jgi:hypothetical protein
VWEIADELSRKTGRRARRTEVIARFVAEGGNSNTANTQYQAWKNDFEAGIQVGSEEVPLWRRDPGNVEPQPLTVAPDGRLLIPAAMREAMLLGPEGKVTARVVDGELRVIAPMAALRQVQELLRGAVPPGISLSDELIADRRAEARREDDAQREDDE